jgi:hypothetical protein
MMASGEIRLSSTTMRQMPVLAQSQNGGSTALLGPAAAVGTDVAAGTATGTGTIGLAAILAFAAETGSGVLLPDSTASGDTTSDDSSVPVYRVIGPTELAVLLATGTYGSNPNESGKYFALTLAGAQDFANAPFNSGRTLAITITSLPGSVLSQGYAFPDVGGAGPSVFFSNPQLPIVYGTMTPPVVIPR